MGKKDDYQFDYLDDNDRFADQINGALFNGEQIVKAEELETEDSQIVNIVSMEATGNASGSNRKKNARSIRTVVDKVRMWHGRKLHIIDDKLKKYVTNYRLNLYDCQEHDTFDEYQTGLRQVFETVRYAKDKEKLKEIMEENSEAYSKIDSDTKDMLEIVANVKIPEKFKTVDDGKERYDMCKAFEDMRQEGYEYGMEKGIKKEIERGILILIQTCHELGISRDVIMHKCAEKYEIALEIAGKYVEEYCV